MSNLPTGKISADVCVVLICNFRIDYLNERGKSIRALVRNKDGIQNIHTFSKTIYRYLKALNKDVIKQERLQLFHRLVHCFMFHVITLENGTEQK